MSDFFVKRQQIGDALSKARADERDKCNQEKDKALEQQANELNGQAYLKIKQLESQLQSVNLRMKVMEAKEKHIKEQKQKIRELAIEQRRITSDLAWLAEARRLEDIEAGQTFTSLVQQVEDIDKRLGELD